MEIEFIGEKKVSIKKGQTILDASLRAGIPHFHACGGNGKCSTCRVLIQDGTENVTPLNKKELKLQKQLSIPAQVRLACQTMVIREPIKIERIIKDEIDASLYINQNVEQGRKSVEHQSLGEERQLVLFFLDIRDFTPFVEAYLPFDVMHVVRRLFGIFYNVITRHSGEIIETSGDEVYAVFGNKTSIKEASDAAIAAGFEIIEELDRFNKTYLSLYFMKEFEVGIGIHSGKVIVGRFSVGEYEKKTVMGLAVNIASRLQDSTKQLNNNFLASDELMTHSTAFSQSKKAELQLKGISNSFVVHLLGRPYNSSNLN